MEPHAPKLIVVPTDFSAPSAQALRYGAALAERFSAHLLVIYADLFMPPVDFTATAAATFDLSREEMVEAAREQLQRLAEENIPRTVPYDVRVVVSGPVDAIFAQASETGADLIVMGTHGRTGLRRLLVGSVAEAVMRLASLPVIVVHEESKLSAAAMRRIVSVPRSTKETVAAVRWARVLADAVAAGYVEVPVGADAAAVARAGDADLLVLGISDDHTERVIRQVRCPVLTVNRFATRKTGVNVDERVPAVTA